MEHDDDLGEWTDRTDHVQRVPSVRQGGRARRLQLEPSKTIREYYAPFETGGNRLSLATSVNDAIRGTYTDSGGAALAMNSDGTFWLFCGTAPDRRAMFANQTFADAMEFFFQDPITVLLVETGVWDLVGIVEQIAPQIAADAVAKNDVACLVEDLLADRHVLLAVSIVAAARLVRQGRAAFASSNRTLEATMREPEATIIESVKALVGAGGVR